MNAFSTKSKKKFTFYIIEMLERKEINQLKKWIHASEDVNSKIARMKAIGNRKTPIIDEVADMTDSELRSYIRENGLSDDYKDAYNMRQDTMQTSTYQAWIGEDISTSLIVSANRHADGVVDDPTIMERIVRNMDMNDLIEDRNKRYAETAKTIEKSINQEQGQ